jgi:hypothetical protein
MGEALKVLVGPEAAGLSANTVSRLKQVWAQEYRSWCEEQLDREPAQKSKSRRIGPKKDTDYHRQ